jgi:hypothetical protein
MNFRSVFVQSINRVISLTLLTMGFALPAVAQDQSTEASPPPESVCESMEGFADFDFWVGEWNVYSNDQKRTLLGTNSITKHHKNCLIMEHWTSARGGEGNSMNYYDPVEHQWRQVWVAGGGGGYSIDYTGQLNEAGAMLLEGKINYYKPDTSQSFRGTWTPNKDGSVRQLFEQLDAETGEWSVWFDGLYVKK